MAAMSAPARDTMSRIQPAPRCPPSKKLRYMRSGLFRACRAHPEVMRTRYTGGSGNPSGPVRPSGGRS